MVDWAAIEYRRTLRQVNCIDSGVLAQGGGKMRKTIFFIAGMIFLLAHSCFGAEISVRVPESNVYTPFFLQDHNSKWKGLSIELVEALLREAGHTPEYVPLPVARGLQNLRYGYTDMMLNMTVTEERKEYVHFIGPQLDETILLVIKKDSNFSIASLNDLKKLPRKIGIERGKVYSANFEEKRATDEEFEKILEMVSEVDLNEKKLEAGRISGFLGFGYNIFYQIKTNPLYRDFKVHPFIINRDYVYFGFSKKSFSDKQLSLFQEAYERAVEDGEFEKIQNRYRVQ